MEQSVCENQPSGTGSLSQETRCLGKLLVWNRSHGEKATCLRKYFCWSSLFFVSTVNQKTSIIWNKFVYEIEKIDQMLKAYAQRLFELTRFTFGIPQHNERNEPFKSSNY